MTGARRDLLGQADFARGVGIAMALGYHAIAPWYANFGWQAVHIFLVVSGFVLTYAAMQRDHDQDWGAWWRKRMRRILPTYWVVVVAGFLLALIPHYVGMGHTPASPRDLLRTTLFDIAILQNFSYTQMLAYPNASLWFVPLILGFYPVFVLLFGTIARAPWRVVMGVIVAAALVEFAVRAAAILWLDGIPVGFGKGVLQAFGTPEPPLDRLPWSFPFQLWAPFGLFPTRVGEFVLGMAAGRAYVAHRERVNRVLLGAPALLAGAALWSFGGWLVHAGRAGWPFADWMITAGHALALPTIGLACARVLPPLHRLVQLAGRQSLPLFLVHMPVLYVYVTLYPLWMHSLAISVVMLNVAVACVLLATYLLARLDGWEALDRVFGLPPRPAGRPR